MQIIKAGKFSTRSALENFVRSNAGLSPDMKPDFEIQGTAAELSRLQLSARSIFWGIKCSVSDAPEPAETAAPAIPDRGPQKAFGMNGNTKKVSDLRMKRRGTYGAKAKVGRTAPKKKTAKAKSKKKK